MIKNQRHSDESDGLMNNDRNKSKNVPLINGVSFSHPKPYRRSGSLARYSNSFKNLIPVRNKQKPTETMPIDEAGLYSTIFSAWLTKYLWKAYRQGGLNPSDLPTISPYDTCEYNTQRLEILWNEEVAKNGVNAASFGKVVWRFSRTRCLASSLLLSVAVLLGFLSPVLFMRKILEFVETPEGTIEEGIKWALALSLCDMIRIMFLTWSWNNNYRTALRFKNAYLGMLYRKIIRADGFSSKSSGKFINMISNDGQRLFDVCVFAPTIIGGPVVTICGIAYILWILSPMGLLGMLAFFLFYPVQYLISRLNGYFKSKTVKIADERISVVNEILDCIKLIKMYAWEEPFCLNLMEIRQKEQKWLHKISYSRSFGISLSPTVPVISAIITFLAHVAGGNNLTAAQAFPITTFYMTQMKQALSSLKEATRNYIECRIAFKRFKSMLIMEDTHYHVPKPIVKTQALSIVNGTFTCEINEEKKNDKSKKKINEHVNSIDEKNELNESLLPPKRLKILTEITFEAKKGKLIGICGHVGSGKTSLLLAALGQLRLASGQLKRDGSCAYVSQQAWIMHATFRENVVFGEAFDLDRYHTAVNACCLREDLNTFPAGDGTEIGERGINLSGGQKQRVALARAFYADRDIYFLDDPLSAVDAHVGAYIFENLIQGALKGKTILFVTHQIQYLNRCDEIYMMSNGKIVEHGVHDELMNANQKYASMVKSMMCEGGNEWSDGEESDKIADNDKSILHGEVQETDNDTKKIDEEADKNAPGASIMVPDKVTTGNITTQTYQTYIKAAGGYLVALSLLLMFACNVGSTAFSSWWLAHWIKAGAGNASKVRGNETVSAGIITDNPDLGFYKTIYGVCIAIILLTSALRSLGLTAAAIRAATSLHNRVFRKILDSSMQFFETTPRGRIQNIFSRDMDEIDTNLPISLEGVLQNGFNCIFSLGFICAVFPWFIVSLILLGVLFYAIGKVFRVALRDLKRIESNTRSPIYSFATATVQGLDTIHAFRKENAFVKQFQGYLDVNGSCQYICNMALRWLAVRYDTLAGLATGTTALFVVCLKGQVPPALAGLALSYSGQMSGVFQFTMRVISETELRFISVERINYYLKTLTNENDATKPSSKPLGDWPRNGEIEFKNVDLRYRENLPTVLNQVSFRIQANEKIGIVGRTGSGKSSILAALFRLVELSEGTITIDGVDISRVDMKRLRSNISIIPQDPVLFNGTVRFNLNPHGRSTDDDLWSVLEQTHLKNKVGAMPGQLDAVIETGGSNLSMGERQLLCLARALLRRSKILVLDEATAAVDPETEAVVQVTIQNEFSQCTILTIAHRLQTVLSCDRIIVLKAGKVVEFDRPSKLLDDSNSEFSGMMNAADKVMKGCY